MAQRRKLTVSIGIPAYNEERNIKAFLESVLAQREDNIQIHEIIVISDGSTDRTARIAKSVQDPRLKIVVGRKRKGQFARLNQLFKMFTGDVLALFDSDVVLNDDRVVENLASHFSTDNSVGLVGGYPQPVPAEAFVEKAVNVMYQAREVLRLQARGGHNARAALGGALALSRAFASDILIPQDVPSDSFMYFSCVIKGFEFRHEKRAVVWYRLPQTVRDQVQQGARFLMNKRSLEKYFDSQLIAEAYEVPLTLRIKIVVHQIIKNPLGYLLMKYMHFQSIKISRQQQFNAKWAPISSSKRLNISNKRLTAVE